MSFHITCLTGALVGFTRAKLGKCGHGHNVGYPLWGPCGIVVGFPYMGFHQVCQYGSHMGFMRATHTWVCANVGPTRALSGLLNWVCRPNGFPNVPLIYSNKNDYF